MHIHPIVTDTDTLHQLCGRLVEHPFVAVDTEFIRENTYYPELCLVQLASPEEAFAVDPLAQGIDLAPLFALLANHDVLKVLHACGQDIEIFLHMTGEIPQPLFDTQVAAMALGLGDQISYASLVAHFAHKQLDKGARFTDWARRPLTERQIGYAIGDVTWLSGLFPELLSLLKESGRGAWLDEAMADMTDPAHYISEPDEMWHHLRLPSRKPETLGRLKALAAWREREAQDKNVPRGRIMKDEALVDLAGAPPGEQADLARVRGLSQAWKTNGIGARLMETLAQASPLPREEIPTGRDGAGASAAAKEVAGLLKLLLKIRAREEHVAARLIASSSDLDRLAAGARDDLPLLTGWRRAIFGDQALAFIEGKQSLTVRDGQIAIVAAAGAELPATD